MVEEGKGVDSGPKSGGSTKGRVVGIVTITILAVVGFFLLQMDEGKRAKISEKMGKKHNTEAGSKHGAGTGGPSGGHTSVPGAAAAPGGTTAPTAATEAHSPSHAAAYMVTSGGTGPSPTPNNDNAGEVPAPSDPNANTEKVNP